MAMTPSAKKKLGALGIALVALAIDRGLIFSGGSNANAQAALGPTSATTPNATQQKNSDAAPAVEVASVLEALRETVAKHEPQRDAFRLPEILVPQQESAPEPIPSDDNDPAPQPHPEPSAPDLPSFEVTSIIAASTNDPMAVINGTPIRVGQTRNGITLISVSSRSATIRYADRVIRVDLNSDH